MDVHDVGHAIDARDRCDVAVEVIVEIASEYRVDGVPRGGQQERMAVRRSPHDSLGGNPAGGARSVLHDKRLAEPLRQPLTQQTGEYVGCAAGAKALDRCTGRDG